MLHKLDLVCCGVMLVKGGRDGVEAAGGVREQGDERVRGGLQGGCLYTCTGGMREFEA